MIIYEENQVKKLIFGGYDLFIKSLNLEDLLTPEKGLIKTRNFSLISKEILFFNEENLIGINHNRQVLLIDISDINSPDLLLRI